MPSSPDSRLSITRCKQYSPVVRKARPILGDLVLLRGVHGDAVELGLIIELDYVGSRYGPEAYRIYHLDTVTKRWEIYTWLGCRDINVIQNLLTPE
jgi:hypothetical protein